ncbi:MAG: hypothetical protein AB2401_08925, partial [Bacillus sp. (in: firmicutes)]
IDASASLFQIGDAFDNVNGKADEMAQKSPGEQWESSMRELQTALLPLGEQLTDIAMEVLPPIVDGLEKLGNWFKELPGPIQTFITVFAGIIGVAAVLAPLIIGVAAAFLTLEVSLLPIIAIIAGVALAIAGIVVVIQNWGAITDWIGEKWEQFTTWLSEAVTNMKNGFVNRFNEMKDGAVNKVTELRDKATATITGFKDNAINKVNELKTSFVNGVNNLKDGAIGKFNDLRDKAGDVLRQTRDKIMNPINEARDKVEDAVDDIKGFFSGLGDKLKIEIPKPKLPRFTISGKFDLVPPDISVPRIGVEWRAKGGIFTQPTIFGASGGQLQGAGEAGPEAVLPLNEKTLGDIGKGIAAEMGGSSEVVVHVYLDADEVNTKLAPGMSKQLNNANKVKARSQGVIIR